MMEYYRIYYGILTMYVQGVPFVAALGSKLPNGFYPG